MKNETIKQLKKILVGVCKKLMPRPSKWTRYEPLRSQSFTVVSRINVANAGWFGQKACHQTKWFRTQTFVREKKNTS